MSRHPTWISDGWCVFWSIRLSLSEIVYVFFWLWPVFEQRMSKLGAGTWLKVWWLEGWLRIVSVGTKGIRNFHGLVSKCGLCSSIRCLPELGAETLHISLFLNEKISCAIVWWKGLIFFLILEYFTFKRLSVRRGFGHWTVLVLLETVRLI